MSEERFKDKARRRKEEVRSRFLGGRHAALMQRVAEYAVAPQGQAAHVMLMRGGSGGKGGGGAAGDEDGAAARIAALGRDDAALLELLETIREFAAAPDCAPAKKMPSGLNGFQRAMAR